MATPHPPRNRARDPRWLAWVMACAAGVLGGLGPTPPVDDGGDPPPDPGSGTTPAFPAVPTRPWTANTHLIRNAVASNHARFILLGDSLFNLTTPGGGFKSGAAMLVQVGVFGHVRAFQVGGADSADMPARIYAPSPGANGVAISLNHDGAKSVTASPDGPEYIGLPVYCNGARIDTPTWAPPGGAVGILTFSCAWLADAVHPAWSPADGDGMGCRVVYYAPGGATTLNAPLTIRDTSNTGAVRGVTNLATGADSGPPTPGQFNRLASDYLITGDSGAGAKSLVLTTGAPIGATGYLLLNDPIFYHADDDGAGHPVRIPGNYVQVLARLSWQRWNFVFDKPASETYPKSDTTDRYKSFFRVTTLDPSHQPVIVMRVDTEFSETPGNFSELGPGSTISTREDYRGWLDAFMARMDDVFASIPGCPPPIYWFQQPVHHWSGLAGFGSGAGTTSSDSAVNAERHNRLLEAMHDVCTRPGSRAAYTSIFAYFNGRLPYPNPTVDPEVRAVLDTTFGPAWVPPGTTYAPYTPGTGGDGGTLMDYLGLHTKSADAERVMAWVCKVSVDAGEAPCAGDLNGDGRTTVSDLQVFAQYYGNRVDISGARADLNHNGWIDVNDFSELVQDHGCGG